MGDDDDRDISRRLKRYKIFFRGPQSSEYWPAAHVDTFKHIEELGSVKFDDYCAVVDVDSIRKPWKKQTKGRAKRVAETAEDCWKEKRNEQGWRLMLEHQIFARFHVEVACPNCRARLWRSEIEAGIDSSHRGAKALEARQTNRKACQCPPDTRPNDLYELGINRLFSDRADEKIILEPAVATLKLPPKSEPDRVYGLRETNTFEAFLEKQCKYYASDKNLGLIRDTVKSTPFREDGEPLLFPFLVHEAKSEKGNDGFQDIEVQTAFSIRALLKLQEGLKLATGGRTTWCDGPLIWFLAHKGDEFRVFSCFVNVHDGNSNYDVSELWSGRIMSRDGALQLLLIIDYIFDWARDIYRPAILRELNILSGADPSDSLSIFQDNDILSLNDGVRSWIHSAVEAKDDGFAQMHRLDSSKGVIRYASKIESRFYGLYLTEESAKTLLQFSRGHIDSQSVARKIVGALRLNPLKVTSETLELLEKAWTGNVQERPGNCPPTTKFLARITSTVYFDARWEQIRELSYLAVSEEGLQILDFHCHWYRFKEPGESTEVGSDILEEVICKFKLASIEQNLLAAVSRLGLCWQAAPPSSTRFEDLYEEKTTIDLVPAQFRSKRDATGDLKSYHMHPNSSFSREMVYFLYLSIQYAQHASTASTLETTDTFLRTSSLHEEQTMRKGKIVPFPLPNSGVISLKRAIVVVGKCSIHESTMYPSQANVCLSILDESLQIPNQEILRRHIKRAVWKKNAFDTHRKNWPINFKQSMSWPSHRLFLEGWNLKVFQDHVFDHGSVLAWLRAMGRISDQESKKLFDYDRLQRKAPERNDPYGTASDLEDEKEYSGPPFPSTSKTPIVIEDDDSVDENESAEESESAQEENEMAKEDTTEGINAVEEPNAPEEDSGACKYAFMSEDDDEDVENTPPPVGLSSSHNPNKDYIDWVENGFPKDSLTEDQVQTLLDNGYFDPPQGR